MLRRTIMIAVLLAVCCGYAPRQSAHGELISETAAARHGLTRPWFAHVELDQSRGRISHVILRDGALYVQTDRATVHAIDAETGKTLWSQRVGRPDHPSMAPDAMGNLLAVVNGSRLYLLDRRDGRLLKEIEIREAPGAGPALSSKRVYVPMVSGMVVAYPLSSIAEPKRRANDADDASESDAQDLPAAEWNKKADTPPLFCRSYGRALIQPLVTRDGARGEYVVWPTDLGYVYFGRIDREGELAFVSKFRLETGNSISCQPGYLPPDPQVLNDSGLVFSVSGDGFVYAVREEDGQTLWRFSTGEPIVSSPAVIDGRVYVATQLGGMYCLESKTGKNLWWTPGAVRFIAAGKDRVYAADRLGRILIIDAANGSKLDSIDVGQDTFTLANTDTDRIYLFDRKGLLQCLRESGQTEPIVHDGERKKATRSAAAPSQEENDESDDAENPFM